VIKSPMEMTPKGSKGVAISKADIAISSVISPIKIQELREQKVHHLHEEHRHRCWFVPFTRYSRKGHINFHMTVQAIVWIIALLAGFRFGFVSCNSKNDDRGCLAGADKIINASDQCHGVYMINADSCQHVACDYAMIQHEERAVELNIDM